MGFKCLKNPSHEWRNRSGLTFLELESINRVNELNQIAFAFWDKNH